MVSYEEYAMKKYLFVIVCLSMIGCYNKSEEYLPYTSMVQKQYPNCEVRFISGSYNTNYLIRKPTGEVLMVWFLVGNGKCEYEVKMFDQNKEK